MALALTVLVFLGSCAGEMPGERTALLRGHDEVVLQPGGALHPLFFSDTPSLGICLQVDPSEDTSRWAMEISFGGRASPSGVVAPAARSGTTVCFDARIPEGLPDADLKVCGRWVDELDGTEYPVVCRNARHERDASGRRALEEKRNTLTERAFDFGIGEFLKRLDELATEAAKEGYPLLGAQMTLIAAHYLTLEGTAEALAEANRRLDTLPTWLAEPAASHHAGLAAYQIAVFHLDAERRLEDAWSQLRRADEHFLSIADPIRFIVTTKQATILHQLGLVGEGIHRLRSILADCESTSCPEDLLESARGDLAWFILTNPNASAEELKEAETYLLGGLGLPVSGRDSPELANRRVNLAYLEVRRGLDPRSTLRQARESLAALQLGTERGRYLEAWTDLVEGVAALERRAPADALALCRPLAKDRDPHLAAWAFRCVAQAHRLAGDLQAAMRAIEKALVLAYDTLPRNDQTWRLGPSHRAEDFAQAARLAVENGQAARAWSYLLDLDRWSIGEAARRRCREQATGEDRDRWNAVEAEMAEILATLRQLEVPAGPERQKRQEQLGREQKMRLQELWYEWPGCAEPLRVSDQELGYRAFALEDEVILLRRSRGGEVEVEKRTSYPRQELRSLNDRIADAFEHGGLTDEAWRELLSPIAEALLPRHLGRSGEIVTYALHGLLQAVPLAALPLEGDAAGKRWFGERSIVTLQPSGAEVSPGGTTLAVTPLFVVDPRSDLPAAPKLSATYRELFPQARILRGDAATHAAFLRESARARWLHVDAHGLYDPVFPRLSALLLADRPIHWVELADRPMHFSFVHLSGCQTGRWPVTADSGSYGFAGLATRLGIPWAIASRADLDDKVAMGFNRAFYAAVEEGLSVPEAYHRALRAVAKEHPAGAWGGLLLLRAAGTGERRGP